MRFGAVSVAQAGGIAVRSIRKDGMVLKKGTAIGKAEVAALCAAGVAGIVVARLEPGDVPEDVAAAEIAAAWRRGPRIDKAFTGRANLFAEAAGVLVVDRTRSTASTWSTIDHLRDPAGLRRWSPAR